MMPFFSFMFPSFLYLLCFSITECFKISKISMKTSNLPGSSMDQASLSFFALSNGGSYSMVICNSYNCCQTGMLNTKDNNWEAGQVDWFVGRQVGDCDKFHVDTGQVVRIRLKHTGSDAGRLDWIRIHPWHSRLGYFCEIGVRLDYEDSHDTRCILDNTLDLDNNKSVGQICNGWEELCWLRFDQVLFAGTHNSGTGQKDGLAMCMSKNQDMDIVEQLDFGIRFFDLDVIYSTSLLGCNGLETGHGSNPELGWYQCYGRMDQLLQRLAWWLDQYRSEVVVLHFGNIEWAYRTIPQLKKTLTNVFSRRSGLKINKHYKQFKEWPRMGDAVADNARVFVFIRDDIEKISDLEYELVREIKRKPEDNVGDNKTANEVFITTSYKAFDVGADCSYVLQTSITACKSDAERETDFLKLSLFSRFGKGGAMGTECIHKMAKKCNQWLTQSVLNCNYRDFRPNFLVVDYPNYQGLAEVSVGQLAEEVNLARAEVVWERYKEGENNQERT